MVRRAGFLLLFVASASLAAGTPLCCLLGDRCCGAEKAAAKPAETDGCPHCKERESPRKPAPKPCEKGADCACKSHAGDATASEAGHAPAAAAAVSMVAVAADPIAPAPATPADSAPRAPPPAPSLRTLPLLL